MVTLTKGQILKDNQELQLLSESGNYDENDLVECCPIGYTEATAVFEAQYVARGNEAYVNNQIPT